MQLKNSLPTGALVLCAIFLSTNICAQNDQKEIKKSSLLVPLAPTIPDAQAEPVGQPDNVLQPSQVVPAPAKSTEVPEYKKAKKEQTKSP